MATEKTVTVAVPGTWSMLRRSMSLTLTTTLDQKRLGPLLLRSLLSALDTHTTGWEGAIEKDAVGEQGGDLVIL